MANANICIGQNQMELIEFIAKLMVSDNTVLKRASEQEISNIAWGIVKILNIHKLISAENNIVNSSLATVLTPRIQQSAKTIIRLVASEVIARKACDFTHQSSSNTVWAFGLIGLSHEVMIQDAVLIIVSQSLQYIHTFNSHSASTMVWALAQLFKTKTVEMNQLLLGLGKRFSDKNFGVNPDAIGLTLWGYATLKFKNDDLYKKIALQFTTRNSSIFPAQSICNIVWALATAGVEKQPMQITKISQLINDMSTNQQNVVYDPVVRCCAIAASEFIKRPHEFSQQGISNICWSFATLGVKHAQFLLAVEREINARISTINNDRVYTRSSFDAQNIASILWQVICFLKFY
jgi:hypothetical protein